MLGERNALLGNWYHRLLDALRFRRHATTPYAQGRTDSGTRSFVQIRTNLLNGVSLGVSGKCSDQTVGHAAVGFGDDPERVFNKPVPGFVDDEGPLSRADGPRCYGWLSPANQLWREDSHHLNQE